MKKKKKQSCGAKSYFKLVLNKLKVTSRGFFLCIHYWGPSSKKKYQNILKDFKNISN